MSLLETVSGLLIKKYTLVTVSVLFGATAHALEEIRKFGWKGWIYFLSDVFVCSFIGWTFYHLAQLTYPDYTFLACSVGSFWGTKAFNYVKDWLLNSLKANIK